LIFLNIYTKGGSKSGHLFFAGKRKKITPNLKNLTSASKKKSNFNCTSIGKSPRIQIVCLKILNEQQMLTSKSLQKSLNSELQVNINQQ